MMIVPCEHEWDLRETTGGPPLEVRCIKCGEFRDRPDGTVSFPPLLGWTCPSCGANYAPWIETCRCSVRTTTTASDRIMIRG